MFLMVVVQTIILENRFEHLSFEEKSIYFPFFLSPDFYDDCSNNMPDIKIDL